MPPLSYKYILWSELSRRSNNVVTLMHPPGQVKSTRSIWYNAVESDVQRTTIILVVKYNRNNDTRYRNVFKTWKISGKKQLCVESHPSALNMTLPAFAAERRCLQHGARSYQSISAADAGDQLQTRRPPLLLSIDGTDGRTGWLHNYTYLLNYLLIRTAPKFQKMTVKLHLRRVDEIDDERRNAQ